MNFITQKTVHGAITCLMTAHTQNSTSDFPDSHNPQAPVTRLPAERKEFDYQRGQVRNFIFFATTSRPAVTHPASYPMGTGDSLPEVKGPEREADHSSPTTAEFINAWSCTSTPQYVFIAWSLRNEYVFMAWYLVKHRDNFTFILPL
jgi:hypothetical protein